MNQYLEKRFNTWYAVVEVPKPLRELAGTRRFMKSLKTHSLAEANRLKLPLVSEWKRQIALLEKGKPDKLAKVHMRLNDLMDEIGRLPDVEDETEDGREVNWRAEAESRALEFLKEVAEEHGEAVGRRLKARVMSGHVFIRDLYPGWLGEFVGKEHTKRQGEFAVKQFLSWSGEATTAQEVDRKVAGRFISKLLSDGLRSQRTIERYAYSLSSFWRWMMRRGHLDSDKNPWRGHELGKGGNKTKRKPLSDEVVLKLLKGQATKSRYGSALPDVLRIALATGMRLGEICELEKTDVERRADGLWLNIGEGKTEAAERSVPVHPIIAGIVERRLKGADPYLIAHLARGGSDKSRGYYVTKAFMQFRKGLGVTEKGQVFHALRNTFIACMEGHGVPESTTKLLVGHARGSMTYGHYSDGQRVDLRKAIERLDYGAEIMAAISSISRSAP